MSLKSVMGRVMGWVMGWLVFNPTHYAETTIKDRLDRRRRGSMDPPPQVVRSVMGCLCFSIEQPINRPITFLRPTHYFFCTMERTLLSGKVMGRVMGWPVRGLAQNLRTGV